MGLKDNEIRRLWRNKDLKPDKMIQCIADLCGCRYKDARNRCEFLGLIGNGQYMKPEGASAKWTEEQTAELVHLWKSNLPTDEIGKRINRTKRSVDSKIDRMKSDGSIYQY